MKKVLVLVIIIIVGTLAYFRILGFISDGKVPSDLGVIDGTLSPCPSTPNCISSQADPSDAMHYMEPFPYDAERNWAWQRIKTLMELYPRTKIAVANPDYIRVEFKSRFFRFVDDVEFWFPEDKSLVHFRSASRVGNGDMGANRKRMEEIQMDFMGW